MSYSSPSSPSSSPPSICSTSREIPGATSLTSFGFTPFDGALEGTLFDLIFVLDGVVSDCLLTKDLGRLLSLLEGCICGEGSPFFRLAADFDEDDDEEDEGREVSPSPFRLTVLVLFFAEGTAKLSLGEHNGISCRKHITRVRHATWKIKEILMLLDMRKRLLVFPTWYCLLVKLANRRMTSEKSQIKSISIGSIGGFLCGRSRKVVAWQIQRKILKKKKDQRTDSECYAHTKERTDAAQKCRKQFKQVGLM